jgi:hypothetical protein
MMVLKNNNHNLQELPRNASKDTSCNQTLSQVLCCGMWQQTKQFWSEDCKETHAMCKAHKPQEDNK